MPMADGIGKISPSLATMALITQMPSDGELSSGLIARQRWPRSAKPWAKAIAVVGLATPPLKLPVDSVTARAPAGR